MDQAQPPTETDPLKAKYTPKQVGQIRTERQMHVVRFSPCGRFVFCGGYDGLVHRWEVSAPDPMPLAPLAGHDAWVGALAFAGERLLTGDSWGQLRAWSYAEETAEPLWHVPAAHDGWLRHLAVNRDGSLVASCGRDGAVRVWSVADGTRRWELLGHEADVYTVAFHPDGRRLASGDAKGTVKLWDVQSGTHVRDLDAGQLFTLHRLQDVGGVRCLAFSADGATLAAGGTEPKNGGNVQGVPTLLLFNVDSGEKHETLQFGTTGDVYFYDVHFHADQFVMAVTSGGPGTGKFFFQRLGDKEPFFLATKMPNCHSLALHPNGLRLAVSATNGGSNGNGRRLDAQGNYIGNWSPIYLWEMPGPTA